MTPLRSLIAMLAGILLCLPQVASAQYAPPAPQYPPAATPPPQPYGQPPQQPYAQPPQQPYAEPPPQGSMPPAQPMSQDQLDGLLAPIALYPDELLTQVLMASTYPLEVVEAARFVKANPNLRGPALDDALKDKSWDPSVLSLAPFPQVLDMMNEKLEWTQRLGDAFLADEAAVMRTVQGLRERAQQAGNLQTTDQQRVYVQDRSIIIEPAQPQYVYVPVYNPTYIYGTWWAPAYRPWYWYPPPIWGYPPAPPWWGVRAGFFWGTGWVVHQSYWGWARPNWARNNVNININVNNNYWAARPQYAQRYPNGSGTWTHVPEHRKGVAYRDAATYNRYRPTNPNAVQTRENYRGNTARPTSLPSSTGSGSVTRSPAAGQPTTQTGMRQTNPAFSQPGSRPSGAPVSQPGVIATVPNQPGANPSAGTGQSGSRDGRERTSRTTQTTQGQPLSAAGSPQTFQTQPRPQVQMESNRGQASRQQMNQSTGGAQGQGSGQQGGQHGQGRGQQGGQQSQGRGQQGAQGHGEKQQGGAGEGGGKSR